MTSLDMPAVESGLNKIWTVRDSLLAYKDSKKWVSPSALTKLTSQLFEGVIEIKEGVGLQ